MKFILKTNLFSFFALIVVLLVVLVLVVVGLFFSIIGPAFHAFVVYVPPLLDNSSLDSHFALPMSSVILETTYVSTIGLLGIDVFSGAVMPSIDKLSSVRASIRVSLLTKTML